MPRMRVICSAAAFSLSLCASAAPFTFSTGDPDGKVGMASRPDSGGLLEIEAADDFLLTGATSIHSGSFTGLLAGGADVSSITSVGVEIYRVFPLDSTVPPDGRVPTRINSPSDVAFASRDTGSSTLSFGTTILNQGFAVGNSVRNGINAFPNQLTGGEGAVTGQEVRIDFTFSSDLLLAGDHYFFVPQVGLSNGDFYWLSSPRPIVPPGTSFSPDLQAWIRNGNLAPDWLRVGTDIIGSTPVNASFSLEGTTAVPGPGALIPFVVGCAMVAKRRRRRP